MAAIAASVEQFAVVPRHDHFDHLRGREVANSHAGKILGAAGPATLRRQIAARDEDAA
jgi:hypothetical protein